MEKLGRMLDSMARDFVEFGKRNPIYLACSVIYYIMGSLLLGGTPVSFIVAFLIYAVSLFIVFSPLGEKLMRFLNRVRKLETKKEKEYLLPIFEEVYFETLVKNPKLPRLELCIIDSMTVNACAIGKHTIAVTKGAMSTFSEDELKAILAHEIAHILNYDTIASIYTMIGNGIFTAFILISKFFMMLFDVIQTVFDKSGIIRILIIINRAMFQAIIFVFMFLMQIAISINSRRNEYRADKFAYDLGYDTDMIEALYLLEEISLGDNASIIEKLTASHPRITARIERLEDLEEVE